jgi:hypothetical protein
MSSPAPSSKSSSSSFTANATTNANANSRNVLGGSAENRANAFLEAVSTTVRTAFKGANVAAAAAAVVGAEGEGANKLTEVEAKLVELDSKFNEQQREIQQLRALKKTVADQHVAIQHLQKTVEEKEDEIQSLKKTLQTQQDALREVESTAAKQKGDLQSLVETKAAEQQAALQSLVETKAAEQQAALQSLVETKAAEQVAELQRLETQAAEQQAALQRIETKAAEQQAALQGLVETKAAEQQAALQGLETKATVAFQSLETKATEQQEALQSLETKAAKLKKFWDTSFDDALNQAIVLSDLQDEHEALRRTLWGHGAALEEFYTISEEATMTLGALKSKLGREWSRVGRETAALRAITGVIREIEGPGYAQESNAPFRTQRETAAAGHNVPLLMNDEAAAGQVQWRNAPLFMHDEAAAAAAGQPQEHNVPLLMYAEAAATWNLQEGQGMTAMDIGEIASEMPEFHVAPARFLARAASVESDEDDDDDDEDYDDDEATTATVLYGERVSDPSWGLPSPKGHVIMNTVNEALSSDPPNLSLAYVQFDGAATHFGNVRGGRGSNGRTWLVCVSCAFCRSYPGEAFILSYPDPRVAARTPGTRFNFFFDNLRGVLPEAQRKALLKHLYYQEETGRGPIYLAPYVSDP